ncbi:hypothetical protein O6H91_Y081400 [Diphasiastrum complanatum]|nr:hypothetical protein O6H91_Y081400 [Diphasiastrum complanatum]
MAGNKQGASKGGARLLAIAVTTISIATLLCAFAAISFRLTSPFPSSLPIEPAPPDRSFVVSLKKFLASRNNAHPSPAHHLTANGAALEVGVAMAENNGLWLPGFPLKVYVYEMPSKFTYDLLQLFIDTYDQTANVTSNGSPVHRLIAQHSIDYWLFADLTAVESNRQIKTVKRVYNPTEADIFYIPFFTTISYFLLERQQCKQLYREALRWVTNQPTWQRSGGRDHVLPVHHPWSFKSVRRFMKNAIWLLPDLDSTGNWYKAGEVSLEKDVVLPYVPNVDTCDMKCLRETWPHRRILLFFRGRTKRNAGGKIRSRLVTLLQHEKDVIIDEGSIGEAGKIAAQVGMRSAIFCLSPAGDTPSSARLFDAIVSGCIPVVVSDELELPFEGFLDYRKVVLFVSSAQAVQRGWLLAYLRSIKSEKISELQREVAMVAKHFEYSSPAQPWGPEDLTWQMVAGKLVVIRLHIWRAQRMVEGGRNICSCDCRYGNSSRTQNILF